MKHIKSKCPTNEDCGGTCMFCCLFVCSVCGTYEGSLTTDCPGINVSMKTQEEIYAGKLDFVDGAWVNQPTKTVTIMRNLI